MRLLFVTGEYPPLAGGIADYTYHLAHALAASGVEVDVLTSRNVGPQPGGRVRVFATIRDWGLGILPTIRRLARGYDLVHIQYQAANFQLKGAISLVPDLLRLIGGPPTVTTFHDLRVPYLFPKAARLRLLAVRRLARASAGVITTNEEDEATLREWRVAPLARIPLGTNIPPVLPPHFDRDAWRARWGVTPEQFLVAHFGFVNTSKGIPDLLRAQDRLLRTGQPVKVIFLGEKLGASDLTNATHLAEIEALIEELHLDAGWTIWTGPLPSEEIAAGLHASDVVCLPYRDGASLRRTTLITALAHGRPVVSTQPTTPGRSQADRQPLLDDNRTLALARRADPGDLARRLALLLRYEPSRERLALGAAALASHFSWERISAEHLTLYAGLLPV
ncbi:MAG: glycosyltransferase family 4 protein [Ardenticatenaceae bacterium]|nr:glycosyltransferase family 4 protein [Ardenticatenaceae bacterium]